ncbi:hypothetical protein BV20DRAFT_982357 [Pilatotrama ljubarskyi]|nr:hypothetical protein BV20DRAFT_982357 [Pilatotrama ljubarskyi]
MPACRTRDASSRNLEVSTDAPPPPTVSIISPTPRAFVFPINDTRFTTTPSSSPFEPHSKSVLSTPPPFRPFSPTSSIGSDSSISVPESVISVPDSLISATESTLSATDPYLSSPSAPVSSQVPSHRRRRSTASDIGERRPKKGDDDYIKRPENAFILFRRKACQDREAAREREEEESASGPVKKQRQADLSKTISQQWKSLSPEERQYWEDLAKEKKKEHEAMYPNYVYRPQRNKDKRSKKGKARKGDDQDTDAESFSFLLPVSSSPSRSLSRDYATSGHGHGHSRRAVSAPTPPPAFQAIQLPSVWMPSCPTSPTLIPRISGRSPAPVANIPPPTESAPLTTFDYAPNDQLFMSGCDGLTVYDSNGQPMTGPYQNMYQMSGQGVPGGPLLHALSIPDNSSCAMSSHMMSPAESIASSMMSPPDSYASSVASSASHGAPFTPQDALRMMSLSMPNQTPKDVPENVDADTDASEIPMPYGFWPAAETLWDNMESLMNEDFNLSSIPPVELGIAQFESCQQTTSSSPSSSSTIQPDSERECDEFSLSERLQHMSEEYDFTVHHVHDPGPNHYSGGFSHDSMNW